MGGGISLCRYYGADGFDVNLWGDLRIRQ
jgi:hypothetical protein